MLMLKIRNGGSWSLHSGIDRVMFGNWNEGRVRKLRDGIKTGREDDNRWSIRKHLCVGHGESNDDYSEWTPDVVYLDPQRPADKLEGAGTPLTSPADDERGAQALADLGVNARPQLAAMRASLIEDYEFPAWCFAVMTDGTEKTFVFSEAYLLNESGKTIDRIA